MLPAGTKWISFGGSYPGMMAAWSRFTFPDQIYATVSSSAPVHAIFDMSSYYDWVAQVYGPTSNKTVGGNTACHDAIKNGHAKIGTMLQTYAGRNSLLSTFHDLTMADMMTKAGKVNYFGGGVAYFPAQGNDPACTAPACNIEKICQIMTDTSVGEPIQRLAKVRQTQSSQPDMASYFEKDKTAMNKTRLSGEDYWLWQTCNEFGFYQTCSVGSNCMFVQGLMTEYYAGFSSCEINGITQSKVEANILKTNQRYGGRTPNMTRVLWVNGEIDPWASQAVLNTTLPGQSTLWVNGASHHAWTHQSLPSDEASVIQARQTIFQQVLKWLAEE